jgi:hypothetical protein
MVQSFLFIFFDITNRNHCDCDKAFKEKRFGESNERIDSTPIRRCNSVNKEFTCNIESYVYFSQVNQGNNVMRTLGLKIYTLKREIFYEN